jgi:hypothetical protein
MVRLLFLRQYLFIDGGSRVNSEVLSQGVLRRTCVDMALQNVQIALYRTNHIIADRCLVPETQQRFSLNLQNLQQQCIGRGDATPARYYNARFPRCGNDGCRFLSELSRADV